MGARGKSPYDTTYWYDAYVNFEIEDGALKLYQQQVSPKTMLLRDVTIADDGVLWVNAEGNLQILNLRGSGLVTNDCALASGAYVKLKGEDGCFVGSVNGGGDALPLAFLNTETAGNIAAWDVNVSGQTGVYKVRSDRQGVLRIYRRAHSIIIR